MDNIYIRNIIYKSMATKTKYCEAGHKFIINGTMAVGSTITVEVEPLDGYRFVGWTDIDSDVNPRTIEITECGVTYNAIFAKNDEPTCNMGEIYESLCMIVDSNTSDPYESSSITCETINSTLGEIIGVEI